jgi:hypothetical protein
MNPELWQGIREVASDRRAGAAEIVRRAAEALAALPRRDVEEAVLALIRGQPAMAPVWRLGSEVLASSDHVAAAVEFASRVVSERDEVARHAATLLPSLVVVHSFSGTAIAAVAAARARAICSLSEPGGEGKTTVARLTVLGVDARLVTDEEALLAAAKAAVVVGADAVGPEGVVNKVGTLRLAEAARRASTPCYALSGESKLIGADLPAPHPFERTALDLFTSVITQEGALSATQAAGRAGRVELHPLLEDLLRGSK